ncbi:uncharacterized protein LOC135480728 [Liolophura sinensis]|uniref:uncharacterized protein LOC135480728 n=1 Tax=Liolophura sinensis TaxID=3198878 RepID=UPI0031595E91
MSSWSDIENLIILRLKQWEKLWNEKNFAELETMYTHDCELVPAGKRSRKGREGLADFFRALVSRLNWDRVVMETEAVSQASEDTVVSKGGFRIFKPDGSPAAVVDHMVIWKKRDDGYIMLFHMFNFDP